MGQSELLLSGGVLLQIGMLLGLAVTFLLSQLHVGLLGSLEHSGALGLVLFLSLFEECVVGKGLSVEVVISKLLVLSVQLLLAHLLFNPVLLL